MHTAQSAKTPPSRIAKRGVGFKKTLGGKEEDEDALYYNFGEEGEEEN